jgi:tetratricopeptide (TPR) repeat protein
VHDGSRLELMQDLLLFNESLTKAISLAETGADREAHQAFEALVTRAKNAWGDSCKELVSPLIWLGITCRRLDTGSESMLNALRLHEEALRIARRTYEEPSIPLAETYRNVAESYNLIGDYTRAKDAYANACDGFERCAPSAWAYETALSSFSACMEKLGDWQSIVEIATRQLKLVEDEGLTDGPRLVAPLYSKAKALMTLGSREKAKPIVERILSIPHRETLRWRELRAEVASWVDDSVP